MGHSTWTMVYIKIKQYKNHIPSQTQHCPYSLFLKVWVLQWTLFFRDAIHTRILCFQVVIVMFPACFGFPCRCHGLCRTVPTAYAGSSEPPTYLGTSVDHSCSTKGTNHKVDPWKQRIILGALVLLISNLWNTLHLTSFEIFIFIYLFVLRVKTSIQFF